MNLGGDAGHLTYCSNIHPGESWAEVRANVETYFPAVRDRVAPGQAFGVGLRLSAQAAAELARPEALAAFRQFLARERLYVFTINGFPHGAFHGTRVKEHAYLPDWRDPERLRYTDALADLMAELLPADMEGSVSTVPGAYKAAMGNGVDTERIADHMIRHVARLVDIRQRTGKAITLAIEPEPACFLETVDECVGFFQRHLFGAQAVRRLGELAGLERQAAAAALHDHLGLCLDLCHAAVEFEDADACLQKLDNSDIRVHKMQISAGLRLERLTPGAISALRQFDDPVYLHQVVEQGPEGTRRFNDLPEALATVGNGPDHREWRVHFHVPIFLDSLGEFGSTQFFIREVLARHRQRPVSAHLEVETYTWNVLPKALQAGGMEHAIARELEWVTQTLAAGTP